MRDASKRYATQVVDEKLHDSNLFLKHQHKASISMKREVRVHRK